MIQLHVFTGVETFVKQADATEDFAAVGHGHALGRYILLDVAVNPRIGMMSHTRRSSQADGALENGRARNIERLRSANAISPAALKGVSQMSQINRIIHFTVT